MRRVNLFLVLPLLAGCFAIANPAQKLADSAYDLNTAARFGRMDVAMEHVSAKVREDFARKHGGWGKSLRIVDLEFAGMNVDKKKGEADVQVAISWQTQDDASVRVTSLAQKWADSKGDWYLVSEKATGGDPGLLGEAEAAAAEPMSPRPRYRTRVIYGTED